MSNRIKLSIITIVFNGERCIEKTIQSVISQNCDFIEYIIIDGDSKDRTLEIINKYIDNIDILISEKDSGIYDAMNKGIHNSNGEWLYFLNAGDFLSENDTLRNIEDLLNSQNNSIIYSDVFLYSLKDSRVISRYSCEHVSKNLIHQAVIYRKSLHHDYGEYLSYKGVSISDYLFFSMLDNKLFLKINNPIAFYDISGISNSSWSCDQKFTIDFLLGNINKCEFIIRLLFYPLRYNYLRLKLKYFTSNVSRNEK